MLSKAQAFIRPGEENLPPEERRQRNLQRPHVLQLVSSYTKSADTNLHNLLINAKHPYLRVIMGNDNPEKQTRKGEVYEVGYGWRNKVISLASGQGQFRSPDIWEYHDCDQRLVTNIPISQEEANALNQYTMKYHRGAVSLGNPIGFHITRQNCSTYVRFAMCVAGIKVPTEIPLTTLIKEIAPSWLAQTAAFFRKVKQGIYEGIRRAVNVLPDCVRNAAVKGAQVVMRAVKAAFEGIAAFSLALVKLCLGNGSGTGGRAFAPPNTTPTHIRPDTEDWTSWFKLSSYRVNLPGVLQKWQREQASTVIYDKPVKLAIVP